MRILISGAGIAGPVTAYWLARRGYSVTVAERAGRLRKTGGGQAVDLFRPALEVVERMGALAQVRSKATGIERVTLFREGSERPVDLNLRNVYAAMSDRHVEIMRDDLAEILHRATVDDVEYVFGDSITDISEAGEVTFERGASRRFDLVIGADGLHSNVRRLVFGDESRFSSFLGGYVAVLSVPDYLDLDGGMLAYLGVGRLAAIYSGRHMNDARAGFLFRVDHPLDYDYRDAGRQMELVRKAVGDMGGEVPRWLDELDRTRAFYFDSITQIRMDSWSRGRVTLVGDAGYGPGPAVGGGTSLAVVGAYVLAGELDRAGGDHERGFMAYERAIGEYVEGCRQLGRRAARTLMSMGRMQVWAVVQGARLVSHLPLGLTRGLARLGTKTGSLHESMVLPDYPSGGARP